MLEPQIRLRNSIISGNLNLTKKILTRFPHLIEDIDPSNGWWPLHYASYHGYYLMVVYLLSLMTESKELEGIPRNFLKESPIHLCCYKGHEQVLHLLLQHYPKYMNVGGGENTMTPLHICAKYDYFKCIELLVGLNIDINSKDSNNETALHYAMKFGNISSIKLLVLNGSNLNAQSNKKLKPVDIASSFEVEKYYNKLVESLHLKSTISLSASSIPISPIDHQIMESPYQHTSSKDELQFQQELLMRKHSNSLPPLPSVSTIRRNSLISTSKAGRSSSVKIPSRKLPPIQTSNISSASSSKSSPNNSSSRTLPSPLVQTPIASMSYTFNTNSLSNDSTPLSPTNDIPHSDSLTTTVYPTIGSYKLNERDTSTPKQPALQLPSIKSATSLKTQGISSGTHARHNSISERDYGSDYSLNTPPNRSRSSTVTSQQQQLQKTPSSNSQQPSLHRIPSVQFLLQQGELRKIRSNSSSSKVSVTSRASSTSSTSSSGSQNKSQTMGRISSPVLKDVDMSSSLYRKNSNGPILNSFEINEDMRQKYTVSGATTTTASSSSSLSSSSSSSHENTKSRESFSTIGSTGTISEANSRLLARSHSAGGMRSTSGSGTTGLGRKILNINISSLSSRRAQ